MIYTLGVDIGGTNIDTALIDQYGKVYSRSVVASNPADKESMFEQVVKGIEMVLIESKVATKDIRGIGVGVPGKIDSENGIALFQNNLPWNNFPIANRLRDHFSIENIVVDNDVYMAAYAEWKLSKAPKKDTFVYLTISTGISCSIIHNGSFMRGNGFAGELGLFPVLTSSTSNGIEKLEQIASGPAIKKLAEKRFNNFKLTTSEFFLKYKNNDPVAKELMGEVVDSLVHGIYAIVCLLDPHKIVLGGGVVNHNPFLLDLVKESLKKHLITEQQHVLDHLCISVLKEDSGVIGAGIKGFDCDTDRFRVN